MMSETDLDTLHALQHCSTPERWAAFMALAGYLVEHPEQRLGQAVVNTLCADIEPVATAGLYYMSDADATSRGAENRWRAPL